MVPSLNKPLVIGCAAVISTTFAAHGTHYVPHYSVVDIIPRQYQYSLTVPLASNTTQLVDSSTRSDQECDGVTHMLSAEALAGIATTIDSNSGLQRTNMISRNGRFSYTSIFPDISFDGNCSFYWSLLIPQTFGDGLIQRRTETLLGF